jgi:DNA-binding transcriptional LysR family regulator
MVQILGFSLVSFQFIFVMMIIHICDDPTMPRSAFRNLDLNLLRVFDTIMAERSLTQAAHKLALTQPAVSNALRRLRDAVGDDLVRRSGAGIEPTPRALEIWPAVRGALDTLQAALSPEGFDPGSATDTFVLAMADATAAALIPGLVEILERDAPGVSVRVLPLSTRDPRRLLDAEEADLAIGYFPAVLADLTTQGLPASTSLYAHQRLYDSEYVCLMRTGHPLAEGELSLDRYCAARHLLVSFSGRPYGFTDEALAALGRERRIVLTVNQFFTAGRVVAHSNLLTVLPRSFIHATGWADALVWRALPLQMPTVHVDALWHQRRRHGPAQEWLRSAVAKAAEAMTGARSGHTPAPC